MSLRKDCRKRDRKEIPFDLSYSLIEKESCRKERKRKRVVGVRKK